MHFCSRFGGLAQLARVLAWHARGHRFDSGILHKEVDKARVDRAFFMMYHVYILYSQQADKFYVGQTQELSQRVLTHNLRKNLGAGDWELKYSEPYETRSQAIAREQEIKKKKSRKYRNDN